MPKQLHRSPGRTRMAALLPGPMLLASVTVVLTAVLFPALTVYFGNVHDFSVAWADLIAPAAVLVVLLSALLFLLALAASMLVNHTLAARWRTLALSTLVMLALAAWLQANLLVQDYGVLDGGAINWRDYTWHGVFELVVWFSAMLVAWRFSAAIAANAVTLCVALLAVQAAGLTFTVRQAPQPPSHHFYTALDDEQFTYSEDSNIIVVVLDAFQSDVLGEIISNEPAYRQDFQGFTWFRDTLAGYAKTYPSIPLMLSGQWYENTEPMLSFMRRAYLDGSVPQRLLAQGWDVGLHPLFPRTFHFDERVASNFVRDRSESDRMAAFGEFVDVGLFRVIPHFLKPRWLNDHEWRARRWVTQLPLGDDSAGPAAGNNLPRNLPRSDHPHDSMRWLEDMEALSSVGASAPTFRFYHLFVPHAPFLLNEALEMENMSIDREGFYRHSVASLNLMRRFLDQLRALNVYNNSFIAIVSEHGGGEYGVGVNATTLPPDLGEPQQLRLPSSHHESGLALMLLKPPGATGELQISERPASVADLAATLMATVDSSAALDGHDLFSDNWPYSNSEARERRYLQYRFDGWTDDYLPAMTEYRVLGHSWLPQSWQASGEQLVGEAVAEPTQAARLQPLAEGQLLRFHDGSPGHEVLGSGWSGQERDGFWSDGRRAIINLPLAESVEGRFTISMQLAPFLIDDIVDAQRVHVRIDGEHVADWVVSESRWYELEISEAIRGNASSLNVVLELPDAVSQVEHLAGTDDRRLGIFLHQLRLEPLPLYTPGDSLLFAEGAQADRFVREGWALAEPTHRWTDGEIAVLEIALDEPVAAGRDMALRLLARPFLGDDVLAQQQVTLYVNDNEIDQWQLSESDWYQALLPARVIEGQDVLRVQLNISDPLAPADLGMSPDTRSLGLRADEMVIDYVD